MNNTWQVWAILSACFAASTAICAKIGVRGIDSDFATFLRTIVVMCLLAVIVTATGKWQSLQTLSPKTLLFLALSGFGTGASWLCYFRALQIGDAARVAPIDKLSVVFVALFAALFLGEQLSALNWFGVALIAAGSILVAVKVV